MSDRISFDPAICHGKPVVRGALAAGQPIQDILKDYPSLKEQDIRACLEFAGSLTAMEGVEA